MENNQSLLQIPAGTIVLQENERNLDMYKIISGKAEMYVGYGTDNEVLLGIIGEQKCFGEFGLLLKQPAIYTIIAYTDLVLLRITEGEMGDFVQNNHKNILDIMRNMSRYMFTLRKHIDLLLNDIQNGDKPTDEEKYLINRSIRNYAVSSDPMWEGMEQYFGINDPVTDAMHKINENKEKDEIIKKEKASTDKKKEKITYKKIFSFLV